MTAELLDRVDNLEQSVQTLHLSQVHVDEKLDSFGASLSTLIRIEERQIYSAEKQDAIYSTVRELDTRARSLELAIPENLSKRLNAIEAKMPGLIELRKWAILGALGIAGIIGTAVIKLVMLKG